MGLLSSHSVVVQTLGGTTIELSIYNTVRRNVDDLKVKSSSVREPTAIYRSFLYWKSSTGENGEGNPGDITKPTIHGGNVTEHPCTVVYLCEIGRGTSWMGYYFTSG